MRVGREQTVHRKLREALTALQVEREFTKDEVLELYLNQLFLGISAHGVEAAAHQYFSKSCRDLTLGECALLAGLARSPNLNEPFHYPENARKRRDIVLQQMLENGFITREEFEAALAESVEQSVITPEERAQLPESEEDTWRPNRFRAPYFVEEVRRFMYSDVGLTPEEVLEEGLTVYTTVDMRLQRAAEEILLAGLDEFDAKQIEKLKRRGREEEFVPVSGALICLDNRPGLQGYIRALVGGRNFQKKKYNLATQAKRQPGSSVKPFVWAAAIDNGLTPSHVEVDEPFLRIDGAGNIWSPKNFTGDYQGPITLRVALEKSVNVISVKLVDRLGMPVVRSYLQRAGIRTPIDDAVGLTIALGTPDVTVLDQCVAYSTFPNGGVRYEPILVTEIKDRDGFVRYKSHVKGSQVFKSDLAFVMTYLMEGVARWGTGARASALQRPCAGKTGTSNESRNVWFCGYTPDYTCVVWVGYEDNRSLGEGREYTGGRIACPIWTEFMIRAHQGLPVRDFEVPSGVAFFNVDRKTGVLGGDFPEVFIRGTSPPTALPPLEVEMEAELLEAL
jgi:penicillin-binding protein 1A